MKKANIVLAGLVVVSFGYFIYAIFLADNALVKRTEVIKDEHGGYQVITERTDGTQIVEIFEVDANGTPISHTLGFVDAAPGSEMKTIKQGTFVPKF